MHYDCQFTILNIFLKSLNTEETSKLKTDQSLLKCLKVVKLLKILNLTLDRSFLEDYCNLIMFS